MHNKCILKRWILLTLMRMPKISTNILPKLPQKKIPENIRKKHETTIPYFCLGISDYADPGNRSTYPLVRVVTHGSLLVDG